MVTLRKIEKKRKIFSKTSNKSTFMKKANMESLGPTHSVFPSTCVRFLDVTCVRQDLSRTVQQSPRPRIRSANVRTLFLIERSRDYGEISDMHWSIYIRRQSIHGPYTAISLLAELRRRTTPPPPSKAPETYRYSVTHMLLTWFKRMVVVVVFPAILLALVIGAGGTGRSSSLVCLMREALTLEKQQQARALLCPSTNRDASGIIEHGRWASHSPGLVPSVCEQWWVTDWQSCKRRA